MNESCQVELILPSDERKICGEPARFKVGDVWMCAPHYDQYPKEDDGSVVDVHPEWGALVGWSLRND